MQARRYCGERRALGSLILVLAISGAPLTVLAQSKPWTPPRTPEGQPDLQGVWSNASIVALERPKELEGKQFFTPEKRLPTKRGCSPGPLEINHRRPAAWEPIMIFG